MHAPSQPEAPLPLQTQEASRQPSSLSYSFESPPLWPGASSPSNPPTEPPPASSQSANPQPHCRRQADILSKLSARAPSASHATLLHHPHHAAAHTDSDTKPCESSPFPQGGIPPRSRGPAAAALEVSPLRSDGSSSRMVGASA